MTTAKDLPFNPFSPDAQTAAAMPATPTGGPPKLGNVESLPCDPRSDD